MNANGMPLEGVRIIDFTLFWAGPLPTAIIADLGAEVIKVESPSHIDAFRTATMLGEPSEVYERSPTFNAANRNKLGITLDLNREEGRDLFKALVAKSDAVVQNFSPRVMPRFGLGYETLRGINPAIVLTSVSGLGQDGPWRDYLSLAAIGEALSGVSSLTGYTGEGAVIHGVAVSDPYAGYLAGFATIAAIMEARRTGRGQHVDVSQLEASVQFLADAFMEFSLNGRARTRSTNEDPARAPHGCFPALGDDAWITISVATEAEWQALADLMERPGWTAEDRFATPLARHRNREPLNSLVAEWTRHHDKKKLARELQNCGVPAAPVLMPSEQLKDPELSASGFFQYADHKYAGRHPYPSFPVRFNGSYLPIRKAGPTLGEDNHDVLTRILGLDEKEIARLEASGVIGNKPVFKSD